MPSETIVNLTSITDFLGMSISLWMAIYLLARGNNNRLTFRAVLILVPMAFFYLNSFIEINTYSETLTPDPRNALLRSLSLIITIAAGHQLTHHLLKSSRQKNPWLARAVVLFGIITAGFLIADPPPPPNPFYLDPAVRDPESTSAIISDVYLGFAGLAIAYNIILAIRSGQRVFNRSFYAAIAFGTSVVGYGMIGVVTGQVLPRYIASLIILCGLSLLGYSIARHQALVESRTILQDLPITALSIAALTAIYVYASSYVGLSSLEVALTAILAITTHAAYDLVREGLNKLYFRQQQALRREVKNLTDVTGEEEDLQTNLQRGLTIMCRNLQASSGMIAVRKNGDYEVVATLHSLPIKEVLPTNDVSVEDPFQPTGNLGEQFTWLVPAHLGGDQVAVVGIGPRTGMKTYNASDLFWLEEIADQVGSMIYIHNQQSQRGEPVPLHSASQANLLAMLALKPDPGLVKNVEDCLRNLHDYIKLGESHLAVQLSVSGETHIERGRSVNNILTDTVKSLRPSGTRPTEPLPREWHNYVILNDAYVEDLPDREVMARLYISEGTYYRTRRKALRGVTRALMEAGFVALQ